jgi:hypothetical protein
MPLNRSGRRLLDPHVDGDLQFVHEWPLQRRIDRREAGRRAAGSGQRDERAALVVLRQPIAVAIVPEIRPSERRRGIAGAQVVSGSTGW